MNGEIKITAVYDGDGWYTTLEGNNSTTIDLILVLARSLKEASNITTMSDKELLKIFTKIYQKI